MYRSRRPVPSVRKDGGDDLRAQATRLLMGQAFAKLLGFANVAAGRLMIVLPRPGTF